MSPRTTTVSFIFVLIAACALAIGCGSDAPTATNDGQNQPSNDNDGSDNDDQNNDTQNNDTQNNDTQNNDTQNNDTQNNDTDPDCPDDQKYCDDSCTTVDFNDDHCGDCDHSCDGDQVCEDGECVDQTDNCQDEGCAGFYYCDLATGDCEPGCASDDQCGDNEECDLQDNDCTCVSDATLVEETCVEDETECNDDVCGDDEYCDMDDGSCKDGCHEDAQCTDNQECDTSANECVCAPGKVDFQGECVDANDCNDEFCDDDQYCDLETDSCEDGCFDDGDCDGAETCTDSNECVCDDVVDDGVCLASQMVVDDDVSSYASLDTAGTDNMHIAYYNGTDGQLEHAEWTGQGWDTETIDDDGDAGHHASLQLDDDANPHVAYYDESNEEVRHAERSNGDWETTTVSTIPHRTDITLNLDDSEPYIVAFRHYTVINRIYQSERNDDGQWSSWEISDDFRAPDSDVGSLALDRKDGINYLGYRHELDDYDDHVTLAFSDTNNWSQWWLHRPAYSASNSTTGYHLDLVVTDDEILLPYTESSSLHIATRSTAGDYEDWDVDDWELTDISTSSVSGEISATVDDSDLPHVSYRTDGGFQDDSLMWAYDDGFQWQTETIAEGSDIGRSSSIAVEGDLVVISHVDAGDNELLFEITEL